MHAFLFAVAMLSQLPEVDRAEVLRLGNLVQPIGTGPRSNEADALVAALAPPASDADKWFISIVSMKGCGACAQLQRDWAKSADLLALANPSAAEHSWAHFNVYDRHDRSQPFRFAELQISRYPTILVQPPRSGKLGDPRTVVFQGTYGGDPAKLAGELGQAIRRYVSRTSGPIQSGEAVGIAPPWQPEVAPSVPREVPAAPKFDPTIPPAMPVPVAAPFPWSAVVSLFTAGFSVPAVTALVAWGVYYLRSRRQRS